MNRGGTIALIAVTAGVLVAGSAAAVAVINAASTSPEPVAVALVADPSAIPSANALPSFEPDPLPSVIVPEITAPAAPESTAPAPVTKPATKPSAKATTKPSAKPSAKAAKAAAPTASAEPVAEPVAPKLMTSDEAKVAVLSQVSGTLLDIARSDRGGYEAYAVKVKRADGSTVTGYVDRSSGVVYDWTQTAAPAKPQGSGEQGSGQQQGGEHESGEHEGGEHEGGEREDD